MFFASTDRREINNNDSRLKEFFIKYPRLKQGSETSLDIYTDSLSAQKMGYFYTSAGKLFINAFDFFPEDYIIFPVESGNIGDFLNEKNIEYTESDFNPLPDNTVPAIRLVEFYFKKIPKEYWPITISNNKINVNNSLPIFNDEFLDEPIDINNVGIYMSFTSTEARHEENKIVLFRVEKENYSFYDYVTGELVIQNQVIMNNKYIKGYDIPYLKENLGFFSNTIRSYKEEICRSYPDIYDDLLVIKTNRDLINWYQTLPIEAQIDYSFYDFNESPIKDSFESIPKPGSKNSIFDYRYNSSFPRQKKLSYLAVPEQGFSKRIRACSVTGCARQTVPRPSLQLDYTTYPEFPLGVCVGWPAWVFRWYNHIGNNV